YYRLYITYTLAGFLFDLDQSSICRDIQKIERLVRLCLPIPQKTYPITKRLKTPEEVEKYFPGFIAFIDSTEQQIPRSVDNKKRIVIEHTISKLKKYRILSDVFRNKLRKYNKVSDIVSGLVNYRIMTS